MSLISLKDVSVGYDDRQKVLDHVNLDILPNDFIGVIGPNGGGKTTLVKTILKALPYSGEVQYSPVIGSDGYRAIGYLPQVSDIDKSFPISVCEVVLSGLQARKRLFGRYSAADKAKALQLLDLCGIESIARRPIGELSGGQLQRTLLCRALISDPKVLILDEPANFVDNKFEKELYAILRQLNDRMAIIMVSHDLSCQIDRLCQPACAPAQLKRHHTRATAQLRLSHPDRFTRHGSAYRTRRARGLNVKRA